MQRSRRGHTNQNHEIQRLSPRKSVSFDVNRRAVPGSLIERANQSFSSFSSNENSKHSLEQSMSRLDLSTSRVSCSNSKSNSNSNLSSSARKSPRFMDESSGAIVTSPTCAAVSNHTPPLGKRLERMIGSTDLVEADDQMLPPSRSSEEWQLSDSSIPKQLDLTMGMHDSCDSFGIEALENSMRSFSAAEGDEVGWTSPVPTRTEELPKERRFSAPALDKAYVKSLASAHRSRYVQQRCHSSFAQRTATTKHYQRADSFDRRGGGCEKERSYSTISTAPMSEGTRTPGSAGTTATKPVIRDFAPRRISRLPRLPLKTNNDPRCSIRRSRTMPESSVNLTGKMTDAPSLPCTTAPDVRRPSISSRAPRLPVRNSSFQPPPPPMPMTTHRNAPPAVNNGTNASSSSLSSDVTMVDVCPGLRVPLRGNMETRQAVDSGFITTLACVGCMATIKCIADAEYVICPTCETISPVEFTSHETESRWGLGLGFLPETFAPKQQQQPAVQQMGQSCVW